MPHDTPLISTIVMGLVLAFIFGTIANRLRLPPIVGYLIAGVCVGPFTPGFVADANLATELAEIGVILLMFGVGLHFSLKDLLSVRRISLPGAIVQISIATICGMGLAWTFGWAPSAGFMFGLSLSCASTVVLLRALQERYLVDTEKGHIAVGWLIVEDLTMILALVLIPTIAPLIKETQSGAPLDINAIALTIFITAGKFIAFCLIVMVIGRRFIPWMLHYVASTGSRELFRLSVLAIALGVAYMAAELFGMSFAIGAFFAGMILGESELSHQAAEESLPLRDAFAVLFFVSVGMLFDPKILIEQPLPLLGTLAIIIICKSIAALAIVKILHPTPGVGWTIAASLAQIGEFSFILASLGTSLDLLPTEGRDLILGGAILSILLNPVVFWFSDIMLRRARTEAQALGEPIVTDDEHPSDAPEFVADMHDHTVIIGYGRVGSIVIETLQQKKQPFVVIESRDERVRELRDHDIITIAANGVSKQARHAANIEKADWLFVTVPDAFEAGQIIEQSRKENPKLKIVARAHTEAESIHLKEYGADMVVMGHREVAVSMLEYLRDHSMPAVLTPA